MSHHHSKSQTLEVHGGTGGSGGLGSGQGQGGSGGPGYGPTLNLDAETIHIVIYRGGKEEGIDIQRIDFLNWLSPINFFTRQEDIFQVRQKGTGEWLLAHPRFQEWKSGFRRTLWCRGTPGAGKTVIASIIVNHLSDDCEDNQNLGVACIYLNHKEANDQTPSKLLAALWRQLVHGRDVGSIAKKLYQQHREKGTVPSLEKLLDMLSSCLKEFSKVFVIVDAVDEYPEFQRHVLFQHLAAISSNVNFVITSRPHISLESFSFPDLETLDIQATPEDIREYINAQIYSSRLSQHVKDLPTLQEEIHSKIIGAVDGMFLLAKLHIESLKTKNTIKAVRKALTELPKNLYEGYDIAMQRIEAQNEEDRVTARSALIWVANAKRPLSVEELRVALAVEPGTQQLDKENLLKIEIILGVCAGLVIVDKGSSVVRLVHYTTQEYLDKIQAQKFPDAQTEITSTLLTFLAFDGYPDSVWHSKNLPPLAEYSQYCLAHAAGQPEVQLRESLLMFLDKAFQWKTAMNKRLSWNPKWNSPPWNYSHQKSQPSTLWIAAAANLVETTEFLLEGAPLLKHSKDPEIIVASYYGHIKIVHILLENGADVNAAGGEYGSSLQVAAAEGHTEVVSILLEKGANINAAGGYYGSSLQAAAAEGHTEIVCSLLEKGANVNATEIVYILLEKGADINVAGGYYGSSLHAAVAEGHTEIVDILLETGADINVAGRHYGSVLQAAVARGHTKVVCVLLEKGADINAAGRNYGSPLQAAAARGHTEIVHILLERGANVNAVEGYEGSSLQAAAARGHTEIVHILLEKGADVNVAEGEYRSSLHVAAAGGHTEIVSILLEKGVKVNAAGGEYGSSLLAAAAKGYTEIVDLLLEMGARFPVSTGSARMLATQLVNMWKNSGNRQQ
ncbi:ankyrin repeat-containing domain protein [Mycena galopus ATCC 62051]|nr:ankyrin repeat-containing domain protein [Mycena galopus ATCC 62051]